MRIFLQHITVLCLLILPVISSGQTISLTEEEKKFVKENPTILYGYDPTWKPLEFDEDGKHTGATRDFLDMIGEATGLTFKQHPDAITWGDAERLMQEGELLVLPAVGITPDRSKYMIFTDPYLIYSFVIVTQQDADFIGGVQDLEDKKIALPSNYFITSLIENEPFDKEIIYKDDLEQCMMAVSTGEADATSGNLCVISHFLNYAGYQNLKIATPTGYPEAEFCFGVNKDHPVLLSIIQKGLNTISRKEQNEVINDWVSVTYEHGVDMAKVWRIAGISGGIILVIILVIVYWNRKLKKEVVRRKAAEESLQESFDEISFQKILIEEQHNEITDSIKYAKRIQEAILPPQSMVEELLPESFILYKPKDIVAGDFYWIEEHEGTVIFAAADCTGHGVPGAMVSVVCHNALNRALREFGLTEPGELLDKTRQLVIEQFEKSDQDVKDGMDIALCAMRNNELRFAGAYNPLWLIRKGELIETKATKQPIGKMDDLKPFSTNTIPLEKGDTFYIFSDGYADQFGGDKGKKLKGANFKKLLLEIQDKPISEHSDLIDDEFEKWKGDMEQVDDVVVIGVRV